MRIFLYVLLSTVLLAGCSDGVFTPASSSDPPDQELVRTPTLAALVESFTCPPDWADAACGKLTEAIYELLKTQDDCADAGSELLGLLDQGDILPGWALGDGGGAFDPASGQIFIDHGFVDDVDSDDIWRLAELLAHELAHLHMGGHEDDDSSTVDDIDRFGWACGILVMLEGGGDDGSA